VAISAKSCFAFHTALCVLVLIVACVPPRSRIDSGETGPEKIAPVTPSRAKAYADAVSEWRSYQDVVRWMDKDFSFDVARYKKHEGPYLLRGRLRRRSDLDRVSMLMLPFS